ncbi:unnamed protein product [Arctogadus glacialis]
MAKALYDNAPESPEELAFRKGDILSVIEQNTGGLEGWWLCSLHGRQGIAPGNRLKLLIGPLFEAQANPTTPARARAPSPSPSPAAAPGGPAAGYQQQGAGVYQVPPSPQQEVYQVPQRSGAALLATPDTTPNRSSDTRSPDWLCLGVDQCSHRDPRGQSRVVRHMAKRAAPKPGLGVYHPASCLTRVVSAF